MIILLLWGGNKSRQNKDIRQAQDYWQDYRSQDNDPPGFGKKPQKTKSGKNEGVNQVIKEYQLFDV